MRCCRLIDYLPVVGSLVVGWRCYRGSASWTLRNIVAVALPIFGGLAAAIMDARERSEERRLLLPHRVNGATPLGLLPADDPAVLQAMSELPMVD